MEGHPNPPDPKEDWEQSVEQKVKFSRLLTVGYLWGILAMIIGGLVFAALLLGWI